MYIVEALKSYIDTGISGAPEVELSMENARKIQSERRQETHTRDKW